MFGIKSRGDQSYLDRELEYWVDQFKNFRHNTVHKVNSVQKQLKELEAKHEALVQKVAALTQPEPAESDKIKVLEDTIRVLAAENANLRVRLAHASATAVHILKRR